MSASGVQVSEARTLCQPAVIGIYFMASNRFIRVGATRGAMPGIGRASQRIRWPVSCHRRPGSFAPMQRCALLEVPALRRTARLALGQNNPGEIGPYHRRLV